MNWKNITPLILKDLLLFLRDKLFCFITIFCIALFIAVYVIMPKTVDETIEIGFCIPAANNILKTTINETVEEEGVIFQNVSTEKELKEAVKDKQFHIGIYIPGNLQEDTLSENSLQIYVYFSSDLPEEIQEMYSIFIGEMINEISGYQMKLDFVETVLGPDMAGKQIAYRDRLLPVLVFFMLITGTFILANLITSELENRTVQALMTTPMNVIDLFVGKAIVGIILSFSAAVIIIISTGALNQNIFLIIISLLFGSIMVTGLAFIIASISKDVMSVVAWGTLFIIVLSLPSFIVMFPGPISGWVRVIPSFYIVDILNRAINYDIGWSGNAENLIFTTGFVFVIVFLGIIILRRKVKCVLEG